MDEIRRDLAMVEIRRDLALGRGRELGAPPLLGRLTVSPFSTVSATHHDGGDPEHHDLRRVVHGWGGRGN